MATTADIRNGMVIEHKSRRMKIIGFLHVKPGKGGAFVRTKLKDIVTGQVIEETFRAGDRINPVRLETKEMQFLYSDEDFYVFMDMESFEQISISKEVIKEEIQFLKESAHVEVEFVDQEVMGIKLPVFVEMRVTKTDPGVRGNTAAGGNKPATLETGYSLSVPLFINVGDKIKIDTRTGGYVERVK